MKDAPAGQLPLYLFITGDLSTLRFCQGWLVQLWLSGLPGGLRVFGIELPLGALAKGCKTSGGSPRNLDPGRLCRLIMRCRLSVLRSRGVPGVPGAPSLVLGGVAGTSCGRVGVEDLADSSKVGQLPVVGTGGSELVDRGEGVAAGAASRGRGVSGGVAP